MATIAWKAQGGEPTLWEQLTPSAIAIVCIHNVHTARHTLVALYLRRTVVAEVSPHYSAPCSMTLFCARLKFMNLCSCSCHAQFLDLNAHAHVHEFVLMFAAIQLPLWHSTYHAMLMLSKSKEYVLNSLDRSMSRHPEFNRRVSNKIMVMLQYKKTCPSLLISVCSSLVPIGCLSNCPSLLTMCSSSAVRDVFKFTSEPQFSTWLSLRMLWNEQLTAFFPQMKRPHSGS